MSEIANSESAELTLNLPSVTEAMDGMLLTCRAESDFGDQDMEFIIRVVAANSECEDEMGPPQGRIQG